MLQDVSEHASVGAVARCCMPLPKGLILLANAVMFYPCCTDIVCTSYYSIADASLSGVV